MKTSIYEDIQAVKKRFGDEFGLDVAINITAHTSMNPHYLVGKTAVDIICRGGFGQHEIHPGQGKKIRWLDIKPVNYGGDPVVTLFYPELKGGDNSGG